MDDSDLLIQAGFSTAKMEAETRKVIAKYEEAAKRSAKKFDSAMAKVSNNETLKATAREIDRLARKYDPAYAAAKKYERGVKELNRALEVGSITSKQYEQCLESLVHDLERCGNGAGAFGREITAGGGKVRNYGGALQNVGYQVSDFATQVGAGTSATQALGQQLPQLLGAFGAFGAIGGAAAAILIPLAGALYRNSASAIDLEEQTKDLTEATEAYVAIADAASQPVDKLREKYGDLADEMAAVNTQLASMLGAVAELQLDQSFKGFSTQFGGFSETVDRRGRNAGPSGVSESEFQRTVSSVGNAYDLARQDAEAIVRALADVNLAVGAEQRVDALNALLVLFKDIAGSSDRLSGAFAADIERIQVLIENTSKQVAASMTEEERRVEQLFSTYTERTREMARLAEDRALAEKALSEAKADGDLTRIEAARQVVAGIEDEIKSLTNVKERLDDLEAAAEVFVQTMKRLAFDPEDQMLGQARDFYTAVQQAQSDVENLDDADLSGLESRMRLLREVIEDIRAAARGVGGDLSVAGQNAYGEYARSRVTGERMRRNAVSGSAIDTIKEFEGFRSTPYWDVNAYRAGFGSDTVTLSDGTVKKVTQGMTVSLEDANRDLQRRVGDFQDVIISQIGRDRFGGFSEGQQAALTSIAYNYGSLPERILPAVRSGVNQDIAAAIGRLQSDNGGVNQTRRLKEAAAFGSTSVVRGEIRQGNERQKELEKEVRERERLLGVRADFSELMRRQIADAEFESDLIGRSVEDQARLRAQYLLTQDAKRRGIDLNEKIAGTEETYEQAIRRTADAMAQQAESEAQFSAARDQAREKTELFAAAQKKLEDGLIDAIFEGENFADVLRDVAKMLAKAAMQAALYGSGPFSGNGEGNGLLGGFINGLFGNVAGRPSDGGGAVGGGVNSGGGGLLSFDGGGFTGVGLRAGGVDGKGGFPAILHPNETVLDHTRMGRSVAASFAPQTTIVVEGSADERTLARMRVELEKRDRAFMARWQRAQKEYQARIA